MIDCRDLSALEVRSCHHAFDFHVNNQAVREIKCCSFISGRQGSNYLHAADETLNTHPKETMQRDLTISHQRVPLVFSSVT